MYFRFFASLCYAQNDNSLSCLMMVLVPSLRNKHHHRSNHISNCHSERSEESHLFSQSIVITNDHVLCTLYSVLCTKYYVLNRLNDPKFEAFSLRIHSCLQLYNGPRYISPFHQRYQPHFYILPDYRP